MSINRVTVNGKTYIIKDGTYSTVFNALRILKFLLFIMGIYTIFGIYFLITGFILLMKL